MFQKQISRPHTPGVVDTYTYIPLHLFLTFYNAVPFICFGSVLT
jgi:hypothetical protein